MVLPIAINSVITTHSQMNKRTSTFGSPLSSLLVAHPPRVLNETNFNGAERPPPRAWQVPVGWLVLMAASV